MDKYRKIWIEVEPLSLEDAIQRIEHQFDLSNARLDRMIFLLEKLVKE